MRKNIPYSSLLLPLLFSATQASAQTENFGYAITDLAPEGKHWVSLRKLDFQSGIFSDVVLDGNDRTLPLMDVNGGRFSRETATKLGNADPSLPFAGGVGAVAYDRNSRRVFFVPLHYDQLRYLDLKTMEIFAAGSGFGAAQEKSAAQSITRMVIAGDGFGYALSADGHHLYRFNTVGKPVIRDLGPLRDAATNTSISILNNACLTGGGDLVADDDNNLYLIASSNHVFRISLKDRMATHLGSIKGLPAQFTSNGAAVDHEGNILVASSIYKGAMFSVNPVTWEAKQHRAAKTVYNASDLGSSNLLVTNRGRRGPAFISGARGNVRIYPNPVRTNSFRVSFTNMESGEYYLELIDASGRRILQKKFAITSASAVETVNLTTTLTMGIYLVKVTSESNRQVSLEKIIIEREGRASR